MWCNIYSYILVVHQWCLCYLQAVVWTYSMTSQSHWSEPNKFLKGISLLESHWSRRKGEKFAKNKRYSKGHSRLTQNKDRKYEFYRFDFSWRCLRMLQQQKKQKPIFFGVFCHVKGHNAKRINLKSSILSDLRKHWGTSGTKLLPSGNMRASDRALPLVNSARCARLWPRPSSSTCIVYKKTWCRFRLSFVPFYRISSGQPLVEHWLDPNCKYQHHNQLLDSFSFPQFIDVLQFAWKVSKKFEIVSTITSYWRGL